MSPTATIVLIGLAILAVVLVLQRWFWLLVLFLSALASSFAALASIIHFQIIGALGFFILALVLWAAFGAVADES